MEFRILGPIEASSGGEPLQIGGARQRALLAYLLLHSGAVVSADKLLDQLWDDPPAGGTAALQTQVSRLRKTLGNRISTSGRGYELHVEPGELDLERFRTLLAEAGGTRDPEQRSMLLRRADALWHGEALAGLDAPFVAAESAALEELRLGAMEDRLEADLERGLDGELVSELSALVLHHPLRERLRGQLILALYRSGRQADALEAYRETRRVLADELGLEPSAALRELERAILNQDESLVAAAPAAVIPIADRIPTSTRRPWVLAAATLASLGLAGAAVALVLFNHAPAPAGRADRSTPAPAKAATRHAHAVVGRHASPKHAAHTIARTHTAVTTPKIIVRVQTVTQPVTTAAHAKKRKRPVHAHPAQTTTRAATPVTFSDDFSEATPNLSMWNVGGDGLGDTWALQNGQLVFTIPATAQTGGTYNQVGPVWGSNCRFDGNFDERIDYQLLTWPADSGARVQLNAWVYQGSDFSASGRVSAQPEMYSGNIDHGYGNVSTLDASGTLRLARVGATETAYYLSNGKWVPIHSGQAPGVAQLGIQLFATATDWQHVGVSVAFDNFSVTATDVTCP